MRKIIITYGLISGAVSVLMMGITMKVADKIGQDRGAIVGYTTIVLSFLLVYFGIRSYRDNIGGGHITFGKAFGIGISITLISCVCYVAAWEIIYFNFMHDFMDKYAAHMIQKAKASGASDAAIQAKMREMAKSKALYENPLYNSALTFLEPFPVGLVITLLSALILKRRPQSASQASAPATS